MKISFVNSICVKNDAISKNIYDQIKWLADLGHQVTLFCYRCDFDDIQYRIVSNSIDVLSDEHFNLSEIVIFHFGIYYELFDLIRLRRPGLSKYVVVFHNVTPPELLPESNRRLIYRSLEQLHNLNCADLVICVSQFNLECIRAFCCSTKRVLHLPLNSSHAVALTNKKSTIDGVFRIVYISRFVSSKNPEDLLLALKKVVETRHGLRINITFIGNSEFSDKAILASLKQHSDEITRSYPNVSSHIRTNVTNQEKFEVLKEADLFVLPSEHEGFAVPVLEALSHYCRVITYNNTNLQFIGGDLVSRVKTRDVEELAMTMLRNIDLIQSSSWRAQGFVKFSQECDRYLANFDYERIKREFYTLLFGVFS